MPTTTANVPTAQAEKYLKQLCKHWSHKLDVKLEGSTGIVRFERAAATMTALSDGLTVTIEAADADMLEQIKDVVARHLDRFAFREAPLAFDWS